MPGFIGIEWVMENFTESEVASRHRIDGAWCLSLRRFRCKTLGTYPPQRGGFPAKPHCVPGESVLAVHCNVKGYRELTIFEALG